MSLALGFELLLTLAAYPMLEAWTFRLSRRLPKVRSSVS
jgi:hypothetical protein